MNIVQIYRRFLKENGLYSHFVRNTKNKSFFNASKEVFEDDDKFLNRFCPHAKIKDLLYTTIGRLPEFRGASNSSERRKFYRLNKKWKDLVESITVQHNLSVGDNVQEIDGFLREDCHIVRFRNDDGIVILRYAYGSIASRIYRIANRDKKFLRNYYITNKNGTYGKIDGDFNEMRLQ